MPPLALGPILIDNPIWLYGLLSLVPLIILYLIKPKPKVLEIPSLMFFIQGTGQRKLTSFLKNFVRDLLFLIQFLLLLGLAASLAQPYTTYSTDITAANTVLVIDVSASSQVKESGGTRFQHAVERAIGLLGERNTIILAKDVPLIALQDVDAEDATEYLRTLRPRESGSDIGDAILLAGETLQGKDGRVIVLSDFIHTQGMSPLAAKGAVQGKGITVDFIKLTDGKRSNVGFSDVSADDKTSVLYVTNYDDDARVVKLTAPGLDKSITLSPKSTETIPIATPPGISKYELTTNDDFPVDDVAILSAPEKKTIRVHLITNNASVFLKNALTSSDIIELTASEPPVISKEDFDVYIVDNVDPRQVLPGTFEDLARKAEQGGTVIINLQQQSDAIDYRSLLPVTITGRGTLSPLSVQQITRFTRNVDFGRVDSYFQTNAKDNVLSVVSAIGNSTIIGYQPRGNGKVMLYGILERGSDFKISPYYPIFWQELLKFATDHIETKSLNAKSGTTLRFDNAVTIKTPVGGVSTNLLILEEQGIYELPDRNIAVNLANPRESNINPIETPGESLSSYQLRPVTQERKFPLELPMLITALALLLMEILYVKSRGDV